MISLRLSCFNSSLSREFRERHKRRQQLPTSTAPLFLSHDGLSNSSPPPRRPPACSPPQHSLFFTAVSSFAQSGKPDAAKTDAGGKSDILTSLTENVNITGLETQFDPDTGIATAVGDVHIKYGGVEIIAGRADYNSNTKDVIARENVTVLKDGQIFRGENVTYNFETQELRANNLRSGLSPLFYQTADLKANLADKDEESGQIHRIDGAETYFTTHDSNNPNYHLTSKSLTIYPGDRVVMHNVKVYVGKTPSSGCRFTSSRSTASRATSSARVIRASGGPSSSINTA